MPGFIFKGCYTASAMKGMTPKPRDRGAVARKIAEAAGGKREFYGVTTANIVTRRAYTAEEFTEMRKKAEKPAARYSATA